MYKMDTPNGRLPVSRETHTYMDDNEYNTWNRYSIFSNKMYMMYMYLIRQFCTFK